MRDPEVGVWGFRVWKSRFWGLGLESGALAFREFQG